jgi:hypothetical protein
MLPDQMKRGCLWRPRFAFAGIERKWPLLKKAAPNFFVILAGGGETSTAQS